MENLMKEAASFTEIPLSEQLKKLAKNAPQQAIVMRSDFISLSHLSADNQSFVNNAIGAYSSALYQRVIIDRRHSITPLPQFQHLYPLPDPAQWTISPLAWSSPDFHEPVGEPTRMEKMMETTLQLCLLQQRQHQEDMRRIDALLSIIIPQYEPVDRTAPMPINQLDDSNSIFPPRSSQAFSASLPRQENAGASAIPAPSSLPLFRQTVSQFPPGRLVPHAPSPVLAEPEPEHVLAEFNEEDSR